jgi:O-antigen ligase
MQRTSQAQTLLFAVFLLLIFLLIPLSLTFNGLLALVDWQPMTLAFLGLAGLAWMVGRWRGGWQAHRTPYDAVLLVWGVAIVASIVANPDTWRRSAEGVWFVVLYALFFFAVADVFANRKLQRTRMALILFAVGGMTMLVGLIQLLTGILTAGELLMPVSFLGNVNAFGVFLGALFVASFAHVLMVKRGRRLWMLYALLAGALLVSTFSRGAWLGAGAGSVFVLLGWLWAQGIHSIDDARAHWNELSPRTRRLLGGASLGALVVALLLGVYLINSLSVGGRTINNRTFLWECGVTLFSENPITGTGLFTYGRYLPLCEPIPPQQPHSHPHNLPLLVLAEMGLIGGIALLGTMVMAFRAWRKNWRDLPQQRTLLLASGGAVMAMFVHHLLDTPAMMPSVALWCVLWLALATLPTMNAEPMTATWRKVGHPIGLGVVGLALLLVGFWNVNLHNQYQVTLGNALAEMNWTESAQRMEDILAQDPANSAYRLQSAYLWGLSALGDDETSIRNAIAHYENYLESEPYHTANWSNLAALRWQIDDVEGAQNAINRALELAPTWENYQRQASIYNGELTDAEDIITLSHARSRDGANYARFQFLRDIIAHQDYGEYLPQAGWGE